MSATPPVDYDDLVVGTDTIVPEGGLREVLSRAEREKRPLRVKLGIDPSGTELTLGHAVVLRKLRAFQDAGHTAVLIIGEFTAQIGDPTGRFTVRVAKSKKETQQLASEYLEQVMLILRDDRLEIRRNSEWFDEMSFGDLIREAYALTVAQLLERRDFAQRYEQGKPISLAEFLYPLLQGIDSREINSDIELGGTDQLYNNLVGRTIQRAAGMPPQTVITVPLLRGLDGAEKMGKSLGNWVSIREPAVDQYGKLMSMSDDLIVHFAELCAAMSAAELEQLRETAAIDPFSAKKQVGHRIVSLYSGSDAADDAAAAFTARHQERRLSALDLPEFVPADIGADEIGVLDLLGATGLTASNSEARRLISSGAIRLDDETVTDPALTLATAELAGKVLQRGKRRAVRFVV